MLFNLHPQIRFLRFITGLLFFMDRLRPQKDVPDGVDTDDGAGEGNSLENPSV